MTAPTFVSAASVREYMGLEDDGSSKYTDSTIGSNIRAAAWALERATSRMLMDRTGLTLKFTTNGNAYVALPGLRTMTTATLSGSALAADVSYWLLPDSQQSGVSTGIQLRAFGTHDYRSNPNWFDYNLDNPRIYGSDLSSLPNDLVIVGDWGYLDADLPEPVRHATKVLAAYYTKRPDAILSGGITTPDGQFIDLTNLPVEITVFVNAWKISAQVARG